MMETSPRAFLKFSLDGNLQDRFIAAREQLTGIRAATTN
jgi:hypothetical protein